MHMKGSHPHVLILILPLLLEGNFYMNNMHIFALLVYTLLDIPCGITSILVVFLMLTHSCPLHLWVYANLVFISGHSSTVWALSFNESGDKMVTCRYLSQFFLL